MTENSTNSSVLERSLPYFLFFFLLLLSIFHLGQIRFDNLWSDESLYVWNAQLIHQNFGAVFSQEVLSSHPPLFSIVLSLGHFFFPAQQAPLIISHIIFLLCIVSVFCLGKRMGNALVGFFAALYMAGDYTLVFVTNRVLTDGLFMILHIWLIIAFLAKSKNAILKDVIIYLLVLAICLTKWSGIISIILLICYRTILSDHVALNQRLRRLGIELLILAPIVVWIYVDYIAPTLGTVATVGLDKFFSGNVFPWYAYVWDKSKIAFYPFLIVFFVYGLYRVGAQKQREVGVVALWWVIYVIIFSISTTRIYRYSLVFAPAFYLLSAYGMDQLLQAFKGRSKSQIFKTAFIVVSWAMVVLNFPQVSKQYKTFALSYTGLSEVGDYLQRHSDPQTVIVSTSERQVRYYSGINFKEYGGQIIPFNGFGALASVNAERILLVLDGWHFGGMDFHKLIYGHYEEILDYGFQPVYGARVYGPKSFPVALVFEKNN